ncbi:MAG: phytanoyl-CoA dioxygenase family protein [Acidobacteria bacterium]|nr:phytanoyl-CoA dioxygenase family protein [Acidobacteriota bacterium]
MRVEGLAARVTPDSCRDPVPGPDWFGTLAEWSVLDSDAVSELQERGFAILPSAVPSGEMEQLVAAYHRVEALATGDDVSIGSTSTRVTDFVNRGAEFGRLYVLPQLLDACCRVIARPFKLSTLHARTLPPGAAAQALHVDVGRHSSEWPLMGFILRVDDFRPDNGATRFVPGSHRWPRAPRDSMADVTVEHDEQVLACGSAGSLVVFNGSTWHGHTANVSNEPRRSLQGAFVPRDGRAATDFAARMQSETRKRLGPLARYVLALG